MYKKTVLMLMLTACIAGASAQVKQATKKEKPVKAIAVEAAKPAPPEVAKPTGPVGFGPIKFDMSKEELEALPASDSVYLSGPLTVKEMKNYKPKEGTVWYDGQLKIPQSSSPVKSTFVFENGKMTYFSMDLHEITWDFMQKQIAEKYGAGELKDDQKEEQCIYKNGSNFKLVNGIKTVTWRQVTSPTEQITTSATDMQIAMCPSSLRDPMFSSKTKSISFSLAPIKRESSKSLF
jgi:hypothetical protein